MVMVYPMQMLLAGLALLLACPLAMSSTTATTSKEEIKCDYCTPVIYPSPPPPVVIKCPPPPSPPSPPPPTPPPSPPSPPPSTPPPASPPPPTPPPPACPACPPPCAGCFLPCILCPPPCPGCPPPPCNVCQIPNTPLTPGRPRPQPRYQPGVIGGSAYSPPNEAVPYFPYSFQNPPLSDSSAISAQLKLKHLLSIIFLMLSSTLSLFSN